MSSITVMNKSVTYEVPPSERIIKHKTRGMYFYRNRKCNDDFLYN